MIIAVYKTRRKAGMYLYVPGKDDFSAVPESLLQQFSQPELVMLIAPEKRKMLAGVDKEALLSALDEKGYYLQMPPKEEDLLASHRVSLGLSPKPEERE
ncbi:YcgL domain-containing protein [Alteromonas halophila]|uniref:YcgL domain-containing protein GCM10007391_31370 n=1 Tax=Alteromonas halophila TaxID=516698 RepID=A0A918JR04_9ALTE|nr:YcgL domain-containing protein [Alteromonas halophila]GGW94865.1 protein YcgL [Alteromonas halophila]